MDDLGYTLTIHYGSSWKDISPLTLAEIVTIRDEIMRPINWKNFAFSDGMFSVRCSAVTSLEHKKNLPF